jgi:DNA helicase-2/ATP-dependent DNA helicase PcrA
MTTMHDRIFQGLNYEQRSAVEATRGPVCILAGAGSGKTTTITRRIANQVATETFAATEILAVTFTEKAATEMARRLKSLGVPGIRAKTFHAEALAQYRRFSSDESEIVASKAPIISSLVRALPPPHKFTALRDIATAIEWAKNRRIRPESYLDQLDTHRLPIPAQMMAGIYASYEKRKSRAKLMDFEDLLERTIDLLETNVEARDSVRAQYRAITADEYQDVNLLQETLLRTWLEGNQEICVVGDDYQSIFGFTGATPSYLLEFPKRFANCRQIQLTLNYRSTSAILEVANRLAPKLGGSKKTLRPVAKGGVAPIIRSFPTGDEEVQWIVSQSKRFHAEGIPWEEIAVLYRINARSEPFEEAFSRHQIPFQVRDSVFLRRPAARDLLARLKRAGGPLVEAVTSIAHKLGYDPEADEVDGDEATRQADLERLIRLAEEYPGHDGIQGFMADLQARFRPESEGRGIHLLTYHRAKGLEFRAVFLPRLEDRELPFALAEDEQLSEERRLFYVGITRAKERLAISWALYRENERAKRRSPSPFLEEIGVPTLTSTLPKTASPKVATGRREVASANASLFEALKRWRLEESRRAGVPAYVVFADETLAKISEMRPRSLDSLLKVPGIGPAKSSRYGVKVLALVARHSEK